MLLGIKLDDICHKKLACLAIVKKDKMKNVVVIAIKYLLSSCTSTDIKMAKTIIKYDFLQASFNDIKIQNRHATFDIKEKDVELFSALVERTGLPKATTLRLAIYAYWAFLNQEEAQSVVDKMNKIKELLR